MKQATSPTDAARTLDVLALGEAMIEFNQQDAQHYLAGFGGDTSNCAIAAARMGARTGYLTQLGDDRFGDDLLALWQREGVATEGVARVAGGQTAVYFVHHDARGHHFSYRRAGSAASRMGAADLPAGLIERAQWLHCSGISQAISASAGEAVAAAIARARAAGTRVSYDLNFRPSLWPAAQALQAAQATLAHCDLFFPSIDEVAALTGISDPQSIIDWSHAQGARMVALKLGPQGSLLSLGDGRPQWIAPHPVQAVDATGAGDCYAGALLARLAAGDTPAQAGRAANVAAALSTLGHGAVAPLPHWAAVQAVLAQG